jgi:hypothetical protein
MLANQHKNRDNSSRTSQGSRRYSAKGSERSHTSSYKDKARAIYNNLGVTNATNEQLSPQQNKNLDEDQLKLKAFSYLDKMGILKDKINKRYYRDNDLADHLKVNKKQ